MKLKSLKRFTPKRFRAIWLAPVFALVTLLAWSAASPMGSSPDGDFHLASIWCANPSDTAACLPGASTEYRVVPEAVHEAPCFAMEQTKSAACQADELSFDPTPVIETNRGNFVGNYPPVYYAAMSVFVGSDIVASVVVMRVVNVLLFIAIFGALYLLLPIARRPALVWGWLITTVPLGLFLLASNNPSSWAIMGVGFAWIALFGYFEAVGKRKIALGSIFALAVVMAAGSRGDAAVYVVVGIGAVGILQFALNKKFFVEAILPVIMVVVSAYFFLMSQHSDIGTHGFTDTGTGTDIANGVDMDVLTGAIPTGTEPLSGFSLMAFNVLNIPQLLAGVFGSWALGWLDTTMPALVTFGGVAVFVAIGCGGLSRVSKKKLIVVALLGISLWVIPVYTLGVGNNTVGELVQPRYLLPLIVLLGGILMLTKGSQRIDFSRSQLVLVVGTLSVVQFVALHMNIRRYVTGTDAPGLNLNANIEWWWEMPFSPMAVWVGGSIAYALLVTILVREISRRSIGASADRVAVKPATDESTVANGDQAVAKATVSSGGELV